MLDSTGVRLRFCINSIMKTITKKSCPHCSTDISSSNFTRHISKCHGDGTWKQQEKYRKEKVKNTIYKCDICSKEFTSASALSGHKHRSHTNVLDQRRLGKLGQAKLQEMISMGILPSSYSHSDETKNRMSVIACERLAKHSKYSKNIEYKSGIILESSFEVRTAVILDSLNIEWIKVRKGYIWNDNGKIRRYIPDFYLPAHNIFLDPKNDYLITKDKRKIESAMTLNDIKVIVLSDNQISEIFIKNLLL